MRRSVYFLLFLGFSVLTLAPARAADSPFVVKDVKVDASGASASEAYTIAVNSGRRRAWVTLVHRLTRQDDWSRLENIDETALQRMISGYQVANEKRSTTRYVADVTYTFNGGLVRNYLRSTNVAYSDTAAPPLLVIPMAPGYAPKSPWAAAWTGSASAAGSVPLSLPAGDALDVSALGAIDFATASWSDVQPAASRAHATKAALVQADPPSGGHITVRIRILSAAPPQTLPPVNVPVPAGASPDQAYAAAMQAAADAIGDAWKARAAVDFNHRSTLTADIRMDSLGQWGAIRQRLAKVPLVTNINVLAMNIGQARVAISYAGTIAQLSDFLSQASLGLTSRDGVWWLDLQSAGGMDPQ